MLAGKFGGVVMILFFIESLSDQLLGYVTKRRYSTNDEKDV
jgi:hypothetical protein